MKKLIVEEPYAEPQEYVWMPQMKVKFGLQEDAAALEEGKTVFKGDTAFSLEEEGDCSS